MTYKFSYPKLSAQQSGSAAGTGVPWLMGLIFIGVGVYIMLAGMGLTSIGRLLVAPWVIIIVGAIFALAGVALIYQVLMPAPAIPAGVRTGAIQTILPEERPAKLVQNWIGVVIFDGLIGLFWYLILSGTKGEGDIWVAYVVLGIFTPFALYYLYWCIKITLSALRFGLIPLQLQPATGDSQRLLKARLPVPRQDVLTNIGAKLICYTVRWERVRTAKGGTSISKSKKENWSSALQRIPVRPGGSMEIAIAIPPYLPATTTTLNASSGAVTLDSDYFAWLLEITADVPGVDLYRSYEVPVPAATEAMLAKVEPEPEQVTAAKAAEVAAQKAAAVGTVAEAEFRAGKSADAITDKLLKQGLALSVIQAGMQQIADNPAALHRGSAQIWVAQQKKIQSEVDAGQLMMLRRPAEPRPPQARRATQAANIGTRVPAGQGWQSLVENMFGVKQEAPAPASAGTNLAKVLASIIPFLAFGIYFYIQYSNSEKRMETSRQQAAQVQAETQAKNEALRQRFHDYQIVPDATTTSVYVTGRGITAEQQGNNLLMKLAEIRLEKNETKQEVSYNSVGINVYQTQGNRSNNLGTVWSWEIRGKLTAAAPVTVVRDQVFTLNKVGTACNGGNCKARLLLGFVTGPASSGAENTAFAVINVTAGASIAQSSAPSKYWDTYYNRAITARQQKRNTEAERLFQETMDFIRKNLSPEHPAMARALASRANLYWNMGNKTQYEQDMLQAYTILDRYPDSEIKQELGVTSYALDKEQVASWLGDYYWDANRYADSYKYYQLAYAAAPALQTTDYSRNMKLAFSSSGVMKTACTLGKWDIADQAMVELKQRYKKVEPETQKELDYWIQTGEPRLKNRSC